MKSRLRSIATVILFGASLALLLGFLSSVHPAFDSFAHFRAHLAILTMAIALPLLFTPERLLALSALVFAVTSFSSILPFMRVPMVPAAAFAPKPADSAVYRLLEINLRYNNPTPEKVLSLIGRIQPDVVTLTEVGSMWEEKLALLKQAYPQQLICPRIRQPFSVAILSRRPLDESREARCAARLSLAVAPVDFGGTTIDVGAIHLGWPWPRPQARQIFRLEPHLAGLGDDAIVAGDLNAAPWSAAAASVAKAGGLMLIPSPGPTWIHRLLPKALLFAGLPIDNVFAKGSVIVHSSERLEDIGSDHVPLLVEFSIRPSSDEPEDEQESATVFLRQPLRRDSPSM
ncbi:endonuclease/exonuclease/phosphatase (EEP) superfamily protein YafD [Aquamicrobium lusatiense]|uniref:Endonuclease/exonuclease/phosphatase (EEP) superfamily protein YafD n=1 Tax=Aquamicrobium lusatiense TaxID=89772 RepID=A0A7W9VUT2_9HYPH|nr:endonuclease/exonuclease/phosphatase family protein [Aquamicrobium lusatiense]MBB6012348.1 endonuclease/exonuclease/phosphatase (EEP) superfamily protein YafD [Aquamicrobium lusatiense]